MNDPGPGSGLPPDAERMGLTPLTAPGLRIAGSLPGSWSRVRGYVWTLVGIVAVLVAISLVLIFA